MTGALKERVRSALGKRDSRWYDGLAAELSAWCWSDLASLGLNRETYSSTRVIRLDPTSTRRGYLSNSSGWDRPLLIEPFDDTMRGRYGPLGLRAPTAAFDISAFENKLANGMMLLNRILPVAAAVKTLVWSLTPVDVEGPEYDTSYSDPAVPFSIFIGAHPAVDQISPLRLAEGVLHEVMHLQLSLIEGVVPLIHGGSDWRRSPWQDRLRPVQGLLHGLYVFRVIQDFLRETIASGNLNFPDIVHAQKRIRQIDDDCAELAAMRDSVDLTADGSRLTQALLG